VHPVRLRRAQGQQRAVVAIWKNDWSVYQSVGSRSKSKRWNGVLRLTLTLLLVFLGSTTFLLHYPEFQNFFVLPKNVLLAVMVVAGVSGVWLPWRLLFQIGPATVFFLGVVIRKLKTKETDD